MNIKQNSILYFIVILFLFFLISLLFRIHIIYVLRYILIEPFKCSMRSIVHVYAIWFFILFIILFLVLLELGFHSRSLYLDIRLYIFEFKVTYLVTRMALLDLRFKIYYKKAILPFLNKWVKPIKDYVVEYAKFRQWLQEFLFTGEYSVWKEFKKKWF